VSTIWLGINHRFGDGAPLIFETMVLYDGPEDLRANATEQRAAATADHRLEIDDICDSRKFVSERQFLIIFGLHTRFRGGSANAAAALANQDR
jgi:hypothetical protein